LKRKFHPVFAAQHVVASGDASETKAAKKSTAAKVEATPEMIENDNRRNSHYHRLTYIPTFMSN